MSTIKKTIFLSNKESSNKGMATLTLDKLNNGVYCTLKAFNMPKYTNLVLGIKCTDQIIKQNVNLTNSVYNFKINSGIDFDQTLGCVLLECENDKITPIIWGSEKTSDYKSQIICSLKESINKLQSAPKKETSLKIDKSDINTHKNENPSNSVVNTKNSVSYQYGNSHNSYNYVGNENNNNQDNEDPETFEQNNTSAIENQINFEDLFCDAIAPYKSIQDIKEHENHTNIMSTNSEIASALNPTALFESDDNEIENIVEEELSKETLNKNGNEHKFYSMIADQLEELFDRYPREENLENLVENSRWVKINYEDQDKYYVVGIIYLNNDIKYICYGVPGNYYTEPPRELKNYSQWLPVNVKNPYDNGYWVMYQDSDTGENVVVN